MKLVIKWSCEWLAANLAGPVGPDRLCPPRDLSGPSALDLDGYG